MNFSTVPVTSKQRFRIDARRRNILELIQGNIQRIQNLSLILLVYQFIYWLAFYAATTCIVVLVFLPPFFSLYEFLFRFCNETK